MFDGLHLKGLQPVNDLQGHCRCCHFIGHIRFPISLPLLVYLYLAQFTSTNTYLPKNYDVTWPWPRPPGGSLSS